MRGRSLLNRDAEGNYKFAHRSIMEYLFVRRLVSGDEGCREEILTDQMKQFLVEILSLNSPYVESFYDLLMGLGLTAQFTGKGDETWPEGMAVDEEDVLVALRLMGRDHLRVSRVDWPQEILPAAGGLSERYVDGTVEDDSDSYRESRMMVLRYDVGHATDEPVVQAQVAAKGTGDNELYIFSASVPGSVLPRLVQASRHDALFLLRPYLHVYSRLAPLGFDLHAVDAFNTSGDLKLLPMPPDFDRWVLRSVPLSER